MKLAILTQEKNEVSRILAENGVDHSVGYLYADVVTWLMLALGISPYMAEYSRLDFDTLDSFTVRNLLKANGISFGDVDEVLRAGSVK